MKEIANAMNLFGNAEIKAIETTGKYELQLGDNSIEILAEDAEIFTEDMPGWLVANEGKLTVALDITVTDALLREGIARELVNRIQNLRKSGGLEITDKISIQLEERPEIIDAVKEYTDYITSQTLANSLELVPQLNESTELDFDEYVVNIKITKI